MISDSEREFILASVEHNFRIDGRSCDEFRFFDLHKEVIPTAAASSILSLGETSVLISAKFDIAKPTPKHPDEGLIQFNIQFSAAATIVSPYFTEKKEVEEGVSSQLLTFLQDAYCGDAFDKKQLCIIPEKECWLLYLDILILKCDGNVYDVVSFAIKSTLLRTAMPNVSITLNEENGKKEVILQDDQSDQNFISCQDVPVFVTINKFSSLTSSSSILLVDSNSQEESCCSARVVFAISPSLKIFGAKKLNVANVVSNGLQPNSLIQMVGMALTSSTKLNEIICSSSLDNEISME